MHCYLFNIQSLKKNFNFVQTNFFLYFNLTDGITSDFYVYKDGSRIQIILSYIYYVKILFLNYDRNRSRLQTEKFFFL